MTCSRILGAIFGSGIIVLMLDYFDNVIHFVDVLLLLMRQLKCDYCKSSN